MSTWSAPLATAEAGERAHDGESRAEAPAEPDEIAGAVQSSPFVAAQRRASIRALPEATNRSYGFVHRILSESGVVLRGRGGATRTETKAS